MRHLPVPVLILASTAAMLAEENIDKILPMAFPSLIAPPVSRSRRRGA